MTLIEMMVVVLIIALVMTGMAFGLNSLTRQRLKSSAIDISSTIRMAYSRAATTGHTVRIVFDIDGRSFVAEEAEAGRVLLSRDDEENLEEEEEDEEAALSGGTGAAAQADLLGGLLGTDPSQLMSAARGAAESDLGESMDFEMLGQLNQMGQEATSKMGETPRYRVPRFSPATGRLGKVQTLPEGVNFASIYTAHREEPALEGRAALYFFPGGMTELAVIQLRDEDGFVNSVEVHPLTARCRIHSVPYEPPMREEDLNEAREAF
jgi:general secretion pathway protein H